MSIFVDEKLLKVPSDVILMVGLVVEFVRRLEFFPHGGAAAFEKCINRVLVFPVHLERRFYILKLTKLKLTSDLANISKFGMKPSPGLTWFNTAKISLAFAPGSYSRNH